MPLTLSWTDAALRLGLALLAGACLGLNRSERGQAAGLRTTMLVCAASAVSMIQVNLLLATSGKAPDSLVMLDLMRLPLGILSGMGFIGGGAILRRGNMVRGVTTAATLWYVTVMGLCFGGGQIALGLAMLALGLGILVGMKGVEHRLPSRRRARLTLILAPDGPAEEDLRAMLAEGALALCSWSGVYLGGGKPRRIQCDVKWHCPSRTTKLPAVVKQLSQLPGIARVRWDWQD